MKRRQFGFSILELLVVMAIVGLLGAIAYPSYMTSVRKGHRADAQSFLMNLAQRQQQYFTDNRSYAIDPATYLTELKVTVPSEVSKYYTVAPSVGATTSPPSFKFTATAIPPQDRDTATLTIDNTGAKTPSDKW